MATGKTHWDSWHSARGGRVRLWEFEPLTELEETPEKSDLERVLPSFRERLSPRWLLSVTNWILAGSP